MATPTTLPASFTAGQVLTASQMNNLRGAFRVLQVISATNSTQINSSSTSYVDTGTTATITPSSTSSKILVLLNQGGVTKTATDSLSGTNIRLFRDATNILNVAINFGLTLSSTALEGMTASAMWLDTPNTTSAVIYKTQFANRVASALVAVQTNSAPSSIILLEISA